MDLKTCQIRAGSLGESWSEELGLLEDQLELLAVGYMVGEEGGRGRKGSK